MPPLIRDTSADEAIYDSPISPQLAQELQIDIDPQQLQQLITNAVNQALPNAVNAAIQNLNLPQGPPGPPGPMGLVGPPGPIGTGSGGSGIPQFRPKDIGYFDPNPDIMPVDVKDTYNIYYNVFSFTNRLRVKETTIDPALLRQHLDTCLLGTADTWYTNELSYISRISLRNDLNGVKEWYNALEERFRDSPSKLLALLESVRYTIKDARNRRDLVDYLATIILNSKNTSIVPTEIS